MNSLAEAIGKFGPARLAAMGTVALALVGFFGFVIFRVSQPAMAVLYADIPFSEVGAITKDLDARGVRYELRQDGQTILAPRDAIPKLRLELAAKGLPSGGSVGYEIFDKGDAFSTTSFVQNINHLRALEGELSRTIRAMNRVTAARVHLALPERRVFDREREPPRASIAVKTRGELDPAQVRAIRHLVASAVEGLKPERVSIIDEQGRLLADGAGGEQAAGAAVEERQQSFERRLKTQVEDIVASIVGQGRARVQVASEFDFNRIQQTQEAFDPESRVLRSTQTRNEQQQTSEARDGQVSVGNELPGQQRNQNGATRDASTKSEEVANYDYTKTVRQETQESGRIKKLSVAVLVDGVYARSAAGEVSYQPRPAEEIERITALVRSAIGFDRNRGDSVEVVNLRFADPPAAPDLSEPPGLIASLLQPSKEDVYRGIELAAWAILTILVLLMVVRPLLSRVLAHDGLRRKIAEATGGAIGGQSAPNAAALPESPAQRFIELAQVNGQVQARSVESVGEVVKSNPQEALAILRGMINGKA